MLYLDMDGVLCDFILHFNNTFEDHYPEHTPIDKINDIKYKVKDIAGWWSSIPPMPDARELINYLNRNKINYHILTAYADWDLSSKEAKPKWVFRHFNVCPSRVHTVRRKDKALFARNYDSRNFLIDDYGKNVNEFNKAGGVGILHTSAQETISELERYGKEIKESQK